VDDIAELLGGEVEEPGVFKSDWMLEENFSLPRTITAPRLARLQLKTDDNCQESIEGCP
jgi:hypothetical protein